MLNSWSQAQNRILDTHEPWFWWKLRKYAWWWQVLAKVGIKTMLVSKFSVATELSIHNFILSSQYLTVWPKTALLNYKTVTKFGLFITVIWLFTNSQHLVAPNENHFEQTRPKYKHSPLTLPSWAVFCFSDKKNKSALLGGLSQAAQYISKQTCFFIAVWSETAFLSCETMIN